VREYGSELLGVLQSLSHSLSHSTLHHVTVMLLRFRGDQRESGREGLIFLSKENLKSIRCPLRCKECMHVQCTHNDHVCMHVYISYTGICTLCLYCITCSCDYIVSMYMYVPVRLHVPMTIFIVFYAFVSLYNATSPSKPHVTLDHCSSSY
jgi:hypothetical protein